MATQTGTFTIKGNDLGNLASSAFQYVDTNTWTPTVVGGGGVNPSDTIDVMVNQWITEQSAFFAPGSITYTLDGPSAWNTGTDTIVTMTFNLNYGGQDWSLLYLQFSTEDYNYALKLQNATPATPTICNTCQFIQLNQCGTDSFMLDLGLADGSYTAYYTDNTSGVVWEQGTYSSTDQGGLAVYQWFATAGMFNPYSFYTMTLVDTNGDAVSWIVNDVEYTCATLTFKTTVNVTD